MRVGYNGIIVLKGGEKLFDLRAEREAKGMTQQDLADKCGVARQTVTAWETGQIPLKSISVGRMKQIADALELNPLALNFFDD